MSGLGFSEGRKMLVMLTCTVGTSLTYALISFYTSKNVFNHVISPNTHFVLRSDINCTGKAAFADVSACVS